MKRIIDAIRKHIKVLFGNTKKIVNVIFTCLGVLTFYVLLYAFLEYKLTNRINTVARYFIYFIVFSAIMSGVIYGHDPKNLDDEDTDDEDIDDEDTDDEGMDDEDMDDEVEVDDQSANCSFDAITFSTVFLKPRNGFEKLKSFLLSKDKGLLWWVIAGVSGIGKSRLVLESLPETDLYTDIFWLEKFDDYSKASLTKRVKDILGSKKIRTILIADSAQKYLESLCFLIEYIHSIPVSELKNHKIRLLLLIGTREDENPKTVLHQFMLKLPESIIKETWFDKYDDKYENGLFLIKYTPDSIKEIVNSYIEFIESEHDEEYLLAISEDVAHILRSEKIDKSHLRPLYAMIIADAILENEKPYIWTLESILDYAAMKYEARLLGYMEYVLEFQNINDRKFRLLKTIMCISIIKGGITLSEIKNSIESTEEIHEDLEDVSVEELLRSLQVLAEGNTVWINMPTILGEYYVLKELILHSDVNDMGFKLAIKWLIDSIDCALVFRESVRQNFRYMYSDIENDLDEFYSSFFNQCSGGMAYHIIMELLKNNDLQDSNAIVIHWAIGNLLRNKVNTGFITDMLQQFSGDLKLEDKLVCLYEIRHLTEAGCDNTDSLLNYSCWLSNMVNETTDMEEKRVFLSELKHLSDAYQENMNLMFRYCLGLIYIRSYDVERYDDYTKELHRLLSNEKFMQYAAKELPSIDPSMNLDIIAYS